MKTSKVHLSLTIQYAADAIGLLAKLIDSQELGRRDRDLGTIDVARTALERAIRSLDGVPMSDDGE